MLPSVKNAFAFKLQHDIESQNLIGKRNVKNSTAEILSTIRNIIIPKITLPVTFFPKTGKNPSCRTGLYLLLFFACKIANTKNAAKNTEAKITDRVKLNLMPESERIIK